MDDYIIVGAGPAGIFCALELVKQGKIKITIIDRGKEVYKRKCPRRERNVECVACKTCDITSGFGGAGAWSDGKITKDISGTVGGWMSDFLTTEELKKYTEYVDEIILGFSNGGDRYFQPDPEFVEKFDKDSPIFVDLEKGEIVNGNQIYSFPKLPKELLSIFNAGGLIQYYQKEYSK